MHFDVLTLAAVRDEIRARVVGGRIQRVVAPRPDSLALEIYAGRATHHLLLCASHQSPRAHFVSARPPAGVEAPSPLLLLLRKWFRGGRLVDVEQLPLERVLLLHVRSRDPESDVPARNTLVMEIVGRQSNLILLDSGANVRDALRRVTGEGRRRIAPHTPYTPPPPVRAPPPDRVPAGDLAAAASATVPVWRCLVQSVGGVSPTLAREAACRAGADPNGPSAAVRNWDGILDAVRGIFAAGERGDWRPCLVPAGAGWQAFAPYAITFLPHARPQAAISEALELFAASETKPRAVSPQAVRLDQAIAAAIDRAERRVASLKLALDGAGEMERLRHAGETLLAHAHAIPPGATEFRHAGEVIALEPTLSAAANAQRYFGRYRDRQAASRDVPAILAKARLELAFVRQAADDLARAETPAVVVAIGHLLASAGHLPSGGARKRGSQPGRVRWRLAGHEILWGRTAVENHRVAFRDAASEDLWLHARGVPGAHVVLRQPGEDPPAEVLERAAAIAAYLSAAREEAQVDVDCTRRRYVRAIAGGGPGQVTYRHATTIRVVPSDPAAAGVERLTPT